MCADRKHIFLLQVKGFEAVLFTNDFSREFMTGYHHNIISSQARGVRVLIHPPHTLPEMSRGFNIPPGQEISIHLQMREVTNLCFITVKYKWLWWFDELFYPIDQTDIFIFSCFSMFKRSVIFIIFRHFKKQLHIQHALIKDICMRKGMLLNINL